MWVTKLLIFPVEIRIFCPKTTKFGPKLAFLVNLGQAMQAYSMPCCGSVGGCGARAVSRKTPIYFIISDGFPKWAFTLAGRGPGGMIANSIPARLVATRMRVALPRACACHCHTHAHGHTVCACTRPYHAHAHGYHMHRAEL